MKIDQPPDLGPSTHTEMHELSSAWSSARVVPCRSKPPSLYRVGIRSAANAFQSVTSESTSHTQIPQADKKVSRAPSPTAEEITLWATAGKM